MGKIIPYLKTMLLQDILLVITSPPRQATPVQADVGRILWPVTTTWMLGTSCLVISLDSPSTPPRTTLTYYDWVFSATLNVPYEMKNAKLKVAAISDKILLNHGVRITNDAATSYVLADELPSGNGYLLLGTFRRNVLYLYLWG